MKVYFDVNIILDWALQRDEFYPTARLLIDFVEEGHIIAYVSPLAMVNAHYFVRKKFKNPTLTHEFLLTCKALFIFIDNSAQSLTQAIDEPYKDFEDDLHFYSALQKGITTFVTRNPKDFPQDKGIQILSPEALLYSLGY